MKNLNKTTSVFLSLLLLLFTSCGKQNEKVKDYDKDKEVNKSKEINGLKVGNAFVGEKNEIEYFSVESGKTYRRTFFYTARNKGDLELTHYGMALGYGCTERKGDYDYRLDYQYKVKRKGKSKFVGLVKKDYGVSGGSHYIALNQEDLIHVTVILHSFSKCNSIKASFNAGFRDR